MKCAHNARYNDRKWIGTKINSLTVIDIKHEYRRWKWICKCYCGKIGEFDPYNVISGHSKTCGCGKTYYGAVTHGESNTRLYVIWGRMLERCRNDQERYKRYNGRGIKVCDEWVKYETFAEWAMSHGYNDGLSIERIDNDGDYCPENCKWIKCGLQARNRCTTFWVDYGGRRMSLAEACEIARMPYKTVFSRIRYAGWKIEDALSVPIREIK